MKIEISVGEAVDRFSILSLKYSKATSDSQIIKLRTEMEAFLDELIELIHDVPKELIARLAEVNATLWDIEDKLRLKESKNEFDAEFIQLARNVYIFNDERAEIKRKINECVKSELDEIKIYKTGE